MLKKLKRIKNVAIMLEKDSKIKILRDNCTKEYRKLSEACVLSVIEKICREFAAENSCKLPLEDLYIYAPPEQAYSYIEKIIEISRIFTVVTSQPQGERAYKLYLEHGCLIRHITSPEKPSSKEAISIFIDSNENINTETPIINVSEKFLSGNNVLDIRKISVKNKALQKIEDDASVVGGLVLHSLLGIIPNESSVIDINKTADAIFVLDTEGF